MGHIGRVKAWGAVVSALLAMTAGCVLPSLTADRDEAAQAGPGGQGGAGGAGGSGGAGGVGGAGGAGELVVIAKGQGKPSAIAVSSGVVYWTNESENRVLRATISGDSPAETPGMFSQPCGIAVINGNVYVRSRGLTGSVVFFSEVDNGSYTTIGTMSPKCGIAVDGEAIYWTEGGSVMRALLVDISMPTPIATGANPVGLDASTAGVLYWTDFALATADGAVYAVDKASLAKNPVASMQGSPCAVAASSGSVFWTTRDNPGTVQASVAGKTFPIAADQGAPCAIAVDEARVYWVNEGGGQVMSAPRGGGPSTTVAEGQMLPCSIALDAENVYWTTCLGGTVMRAKKPAPSPT